MTAEPLPAPGWDEHIESMVVKVVGPWIVSVTPMAFNDRVLLTHIAQYPTSWTSGFCYDKGAAAALAATVWEPTRDPRPVGFKKVAAENLVFWEQANADR